MLFGLNVPVPPDHVADVAEPPITPANVTVLPAQIVCAEPASTVANGLIVIVKLSVPAVQGPVVVKVNVTVPANTSAALGVYTAFSALAFGVNVPVPPLQVPPVAAPLTEPASVTEPPAHIV